MSNQGLPDTPEVSKLLDEINAYIHSGKCAKYFTKDVNELLNLDEVGYFFTCALLFDLTFEKDDLFLSFENSLSEEALRCKRTVVILRALDEFLKKYHISKLYTLDREATYEMIKDYVQDLNIYKTRYNCETVQLPKIAGLMTNLIAKYRPVVPYDHSKNPIPRINEVFAVYHGLCLCSDFSNGEEFSDFSKTDICTEFFEDVTYLLRRNFTAESLIIIFKTLCLSHFPKFKEKNMYG
jgi:hypothetical protein